MSKINQLFDQLKSFDRPPINTWHPERTVDFDLRIAANGDWIHEGGLIKRSRLVKLFSTVIALRDNEYYLVTPQAKYRITVEECPFMAVEMTIENSGDSDKTRQQIYFRTNMDETVRADAEHPIVLSYSSNNEPLPSVLVRDDLSAKLTRSVYYDLATNNLIDFNGKLGVFSAEKFFPMGVSPLEIGDQIDDHSN